MLCKTVEETPLFETKGGGEVREGGRCENVQGGEQAMRAASGWQHLGSQHSRWQQSRWQRPGSSVRVAASGWQRPGGSVQVRDTAAALRAEAPPGVDSCR